MSEPGSVWSVTDETEESVRLCGTRVARDMEGAYVDGGACWATVGGGVGGSAAMIALWRKTAAIRPASRDGGPALLAGGP